MDKVNKVKDELWKKAEADSKLKKHLPTALTILDTVIMTLQSVDKDVKIDIALNEALKTINILYSFSKNNPTWERFIEIDIFKGVAKNIK